MTHVDSDKMILKLRTHNVNGFNHSKKFLFDECDRNAFSILAIQEHWLKPTHRKHTGVNALKSLHSFFDAYATSGMDSQVGQRILKGRPYGGTGFLFDKSLSKCLRARIDLKHERVTVLEFNTVSERIMLINAYMPYFNTNNNPDQLAEYRNTLAFIENVMLSNSQCKFILFMDLNCNLYDSAHPYSSLINDMMTDFGLISSFDFFPGFDPGIHYTRFDDKRGSYTLIDGILLSSSLSKYIHGSTILSPATNHALDPCGIRSARLPHYQTS